jgi:hypothetical protein
MRVFVCLLPIAVLAGVCTAPVWPGPYKAGQDQKQPNPDRLRGMRAAVADIEAGKLKQRSFPLPDPAWHGQYVEMLRKECGVEWEIVTDKAAAPLIAEMGGYNDVMRVEIEHRFGRDTLEKLQKKAEADFRKSKVPSPSSNQQGPGPRNEPVSMSEAGLPIGRWNVEFTNGVTEKCVVCKEGIATVVEPRRTSGGKAAVDANSAVITFDDDRVERWTRVAERFVVQHWYPGSRFPNGTPVLGIAERVK